MAAAVGVPLRFVSLQVNGLVGWDGAAHFGPIRLVLEVDGANRPLFGKGALYCAGPRRGIKVLGLGSAPG